MNPNTMLISIPIDPMATYLHLFCINMMQLPQQLAQPQRLLMRQSEKLKILGM